MNVNQLLDVIGETHTDYLTAALKTREKRPVRRNVHKLVLIAAIVSLMVLLLGCAVVMLNLRDLKLGEFTYTEPRYIDEQGNKIPETEKTKDILSLQGVVGSPEYMAAQEWDAFEWDYVMNRTDELEDDFRAPEAYNAYFVGNQEMLDKIDEICAKYDLKLLGPAAYTQSYEQDIFFDALGLDGLTKPDADVTWENGSGYFYACGNFKSEFRITLNGKEAQWPYPIITSFLYKNKGYFDGVTLSVDDIDNVDQWNYTLADGTEVLIMNTGTRAWIFCDREDAFLSVGFDVTYEYEEGLTEVMSTRDMELVAEVLDFTVKSQKPDMDAVKIKLEESYQNYLTEEEAKEETWVNPFARDYKSYTDVISYMLENADAPENVYYGLWDLTGDGEAELLIGCADSFGSAKTIVDGEVQTLISNGSDSGYVLCEDRVFLYQNGDHYYFYRVDVLDFETMDYKIDSLEYNPWEECWYRTQNGNRVSISEEEAVAIIEDYGPMDIEMIPITEFPME